MTKTARGKEINMAALIAANDTSVAVSNVNMNARGDILGPGGEIEVPAQEVQKEYYEEKLTAPAETVLPATTRPSCSTMSSSDVKPARDLT